MKSLTEIILKRCDPSDPETLRLSRSDRLTVQSTLDVFVPLLLRKGFQAASEVARIYSIGLVVRLVETSKSYLRPWLPDLINIIVEAMSALEPNTLQYLQFHTARMQVSGDELENFRIQLAQQGPLQVGIRFT